MTLLKLCLEFRRDFLRIKSIIIKTKDNLKRVRKRDFMLVIAPGESYIQPGLDCALRYYEGRIMKAILAFLETA